MTARVLILGGTGEARRLAEELVARPGLRVLTSLAGRTETPALAGEVRVGGFGGADGLADWLRDNPVAAIVDATHPFAERISASAASAAGRLDIALLALRRAAWTPEPGDDWRWVDSLEQAAALLPAAGRRVFLSIGRQGLAAFAGVTGGWFLARCVQPPESPLPPHCQLLLDRGPYTVDGEVALLRRYRIDLMVSKDSGGAQTEAKLIAARHLSLPVVLVARPTPDDTVSAVETVPAAVAWLDRVLAR
ncbi:MAG TPA: cobalt-precorrin-6A reductase [Pseudonocardiaceae bacterium]|jgi:precorrin-6A/cobalt-precorrin-6A reductase|nr:cobalt-precorrin-6A reductase [Pseudonocardiaceae bacterium]